MFDTVIEHWSGERWKLWSFCAGAVAVSVAAVVAALIALISGERFVPLMLLLLVVFILAGSLVGSGVIDTLSSHLNRGGLARESTEDVDRALEVGETRRRSGPVQANDRRTIRAGLFVVAPLVAFIYFMTVV